MEVQRERHGHAAIFSPSDGGELAQQPAGTLLARAGIVMAVEEHALLGELQPRALAFRHQLDRRQRHRDARVVEMHVVGIDDALVRHDVLIDAREGVHRTALRAAARGLTPADAEVEFARPLLPFGRPLEPLRLGGGIGEGLEDARRRHREAALDHEGRVLGRVGHVGLLLRLE
jgi:hypothetical protein